MITKQLTILVIEDNRADYNLLLEYINLSGNRLIKLEWCQSIKEGLSFLEKRHIDLVLLDLGLPDSAGLGTLVKLRELHPTIPVIVLTGNTDESTGIKAISSGAQDYLVKDTINEHLLIRSIYYSIVRRNFEDSIRETSEKYKLLYENMAEGALLFDSYGRVIFGNPAAQKILGISEKELLTKSFGNFNWRTIHEDGTPFPEESYPAVIALNEGKAVTNVVMGIFNYKEAIYKWINISAVPIFKSGKQEVSEIILTFRDITESKVILNNLTQSENRFRTLFEESPLGISMTIGYRIFQVNKAYSDMFGFETPEELRNTSLLERISPEEREKVVEKIKSRVPGLRRNRSYDYTGIKKDGTRFPIHMEVEYVQILEGEAAIAFVNDVTETIKNEERIKASLKEKEILLKEIHHRVKNNLQIITSLLSLQTDFVNTGNYLQAFEESRNRIRAMALVHEKLYSSKDLSKIDFGEYIEEFLHILGNNFAFANPRQVSIEHELDSIEVGIDKAIPCGLILNELVTNAYKYAFPEGSAGIIKVRLKDLGQETMICVKDNGIGFKKDFDIASTNTLGFMIVDSLSKQLHGKIKINSDNGAEVQICFPK